MIDRANRSLASKLVRQFRDGEINSDDLESDWPRSDDKALRAVESMVWAFYDDHYPRRMIGRNAATPDEHEALTRYAAFLDSDLPYEWPRPNFYRIGGLGPLKWITLGLLWPLDWWIRRRNSRLEAELRAVGDFDVWPFLRREDFDNARA
jgi:hypothetical protein